MIESVVIPNPSRTTVCVSSQVGCARGCKFCMTATMGIIRNLKVHENAPKPVKSIVVDGGPLVMHCGCVLWSQDGMKARDGLDSLLFA